MMKDIRKTMLEALNIEEDDLEEDGAGTGGATGSGTGTGSDSGDSGGVSGSTDASGADANADGDMTTSDDKTTVGHTGIWLPYQHQKKCPTGFTKDKLTKSCLQKHSKK